MSEKQQWRATYEDTLDQQEALRKKLDELAKDNRCLRNTKEIEEVFYLYGDSLLGEDAEKNISRFVQFPSGEWCSISNFGLFIREICYFEGNEIPISYFEKSGEEIIPISKIWMAIRKNLFGIYPKAQDKSIKMSKERESWESKSRGGFTSGKKKKEEDY